MVKAVCTVSIVQIKNLLPINCMEEFLRYRYVVMHIICSVAFYNSYRTFRCVNLLHADWFEFI